MKKFTFFFFHQICKLRTDVLFLQRFWSGFIIGEVSLLYYTIIICISSMFVIHKIFKMTIYLHGEPWYVYKYVYNAILVVFIFCRYIFPTNLLNSNGIDYNNTNDTYAVSYIVDAHIIMHNIHVYKIFNEFLTNFFSKYIQ